MEKEECPICNYRYRNIKRHIQNVHKNKLIPTQLCKCNCGRFVKFYDNYIRGHSGGPGPNTKIIISRTPILNGKPCLCGCGQFLKEDASNNYLYGHKSKVGQLCACNKCGKYTKPGRKFINGHSRKGLITAIETKQLQSVTQKGRVKTDIECKNIKLGMKKSEAPAKISKAMMGNHNGLGIVCSEEKKNKIRVSNTGQKRSQKTKDILRAKTKDYWNNLTIQEQEKRVAPWIAAGLKSGKSGPTSIELIIGAILDKFKIIYETQKHIGIYSIDIFIPHKNLVIECDGSYWHSLPNVKIKDYKKDKFLVEQGYTVKRLQEKRIKELAKIYNVRVS